MFRTKCVSVCVMHPWIVGILWRNSWGKYVDFTLFYFLHFIRVGKYQKFKATSTYPRVGIQLAMIYDFFIGVPS